MSLLLVAFLRAQKLRALQICVAAPAAAVVCLREDGQGKV